jgi:uncharacterized protein YqgC (DUF456 family)
VDAVEDCVLVAVVNGLGGSVGDTLGAIVGDIVGLFVVGENVGDIVGSEIVGVSVGNVVLVLNVDFQLDTSLE